ncbi:MAG: hypothetical protein FWF05_02570 [Oscillospiraceae bacterium]|nr:hypothetical protein [Oscillospiraceae bacterium]
MDGKKSESVHGGHRKRVRDRFLASGFDGVPAHNVLELLLFYAIPNGDTNETAHELMRVFGSFSAVLDAPFEELLKVKGVGEYTAAFITFLPRFFKFYTSDKISEKDVTYLDTEKLHAYVCSKFQSEQSELIKLLCFNNSGELLRCCDISTGTKNSAHLDRRTLLETAFRNNATAVILAHNHPNGIPVPSGNDVKTTKEVFAILAGVSIHLVDHIIVSGSEAFSMASNPKYRMLFI